MTDTLARVERRRGDVALLGPDNTDIKILDPRKGELREPGKRVDSVATISLGYKVKGDNGGMGRPAATRQGDDKWLHAHGADNAQALLKALGAGNHRRLTISLAGDDWNDCVQQHYACYSASALQVFGDDNVLTVIRFRQEKNAKGEMVSVPVHVPTIKAENPEGYERLLRMCKTQIDVYFYLAEWEPDGEGGFSPRVVMDHEAGLYRFRTTSMHTIENLASTVRQVRQFTNGFIRGVPLTLTVEFPEVAGPDGKKRKIPTAVFRLQPPMRLTAVTFRPMLESAVTEGSMLALPAPRIQTLEDAVREEPIIDDTISVDQREIDLLTRGGRCNAKKYEAIYFGLTGGTGLDTDEGRARTIREYTKGAESSLAGMLHWMTATEAQEFIDHVYELLNGPSEPVDDSPVVANADEYVRLHPDENDIVADTSGKVNWKTGEIVEESHTTGPEPEPHAAAAAPVDDQPKDSYIEAEFTPVDDDQPPDDDDSWRMPADWAEAEEIIAVAESPDPAVQAEDSARRMTQAEAIPPKEAAPIAQPKQPDSPEILDRGLLVERFQAVPGVSYRPPPQTNNQSVLRAWEQGFNEAVKKAQRT